jgi:hypothetical protein
VGGQPASAQSDPETLLDHSTPARAEIALTRNSYGLYTIDVDVGRSVLFSGDPQADPVPFIVDTAANTSAVPRLIAEQLVREQDITLDRIGHGFTGVFETGLILVDQINFGLGPRRVEIAVIDEHYGSVLSSAGLLGENAFNGETVTLDFPGERLLHAAGSTIENVGPLRLENGVIVGEARLRGQAEPLRVIIDTGATESVLNPAAFGGRRSSERPQSIRAEGVDGQDQRVRRATRRMFPGLQVGELCIGLFTISVLDVYVFEHLGWAEQPAMLIGMDLLEHSLITIDYRTGAVRLEGTGEYGCST